MMRLKTRARVISNTRAKYDFALNPQTQDNFISSHYKKKTTLKDSTIQTKLSKRQLAKGKLRIDLLGHRVRQPHLTLAFKVFER